MQFNKDGKKKGVKMIVISMEEARQLGDKYNEKEMVEALEYFKKIKSKYSFASNEFDNKTALKMVKELYQAGANKVYCGEFYTEPWRLEEEGDIYCATLFIECEKGKIKSVREIIKKYKPHETSKQGNLIRIWWD